MSRIFVIDGNIATGKSTLMAEFRKGLSLNSKIVCVTEPVKKFCIFKTYNPLKLMHESPVASQIHINNCLFNEYKKFDFTDPEKIYIFDRYINSPLIFIEALFLYGKLTPFERDLLLDISRITHQTLKLPNVTGIFFLKSDISLMLERIALRGRYSEEEYTHEYLQNLDLSYESYLQEVTNHNITKIEISETKNLPQLAKELTDFINKNV